MTSSIKTSSLVIDSNVWISALVFGGEPRKVFERCLVDGVRIAVSAELLSEIRRILNRKFANFIDDFELLLIALQNNTDVVELGSVVINASRDPDDNMVIETALIGGAQCILSGDKDLLVLKQYKQILILRPKAWLDRLENPEN